MAAAGSQRYVELAGLAALMAGVMLLFARIIRLGFLANFLSRTVLIGFLTGVGVQVAAGQLPDMVGVDANGHAASANSWTPSASFRPGARARSRCRWVYSSSCSSRARSPGVSPRPWSPSWVPFS